MIAEVSDDLELDVQNFWQNYLILKQHEPTVSEVQIYFKIGYPRAKSFHSKCKAKFSREDLSQNLLSNQV